MLEKYIEEKTVPVIKEETWIIKYKGYVRLATALEIQEHLEEKK